MTSKPALGVGWPLKGEEVLHLQAGLKPGMFGLELSTLIT